MRFLKKQEVKQATTLSYAEIDRREKLKRFPKRRSLSGHWRGRKAWIESEIHEWMLDPINYRQPPEREAKRPEGETENHPIH
jgi:predicted DNA-binding transcriptional regulator AlpA